MVSALIIHVEISYFQPLTFLQDIYTTINRSNIKFLQKAFDTVPRQRHLLKLKHCGIQGKTLRRISFRLTNRTLRIVVDGDASIKTQMLSGVPQGTVLVPLMFILYIDDIGENLAFHIKLFTDDCLQFRTIKSVAETVALQNDSCKMSLGARK